MLMRNASIGLERARNLMLNVFHVSDLHYTASATGRVRDDAISGAKAILKLAQTLKDQGVLSSDVCLCITGDLVQSGASNSEGLRSDFDAVDSEFLKPLIEILQISTERVFMVPGNHEMDREAISPDDQINSLNYSKKRPCEDDIHNDFRSKLTTFFEFIDAHGYKSVNRDNPRLAIFEVNGQCIACLNGLAGAYSLNGFQDKGHLFVTPSEFGGVLSDIPKNAVVLLHHPLSWFEDQCGIDLKEFFAARVCRLLTGHIHDQGADWIETGGGSLAVIQAGASAEGTKSYQVAVGWFPPSGAAAVRHYTFNRQAGGYPITGIQDTRVVPAAARAFFERSEAFFDANILSDCRGAASAEYRRELKISYGRDPAKYIAPDLAIYSEDEFSARRTNVAAFHKNSNIRIISGQELSGKTTFVYYAAMIENALPDIGQVCIVMDFRAIAAGRELTDLLVKRLVGLGLNNMTAHYIISVGLVRIWIDNFDPDNTISVLKFDSFIKANPSVNWSVAVKGGQRFMPSRAPTTFPKDGISYYELSEITAPTVVKMIEAHAAGAGVERPRGVVERVFRSITNLRAPRTVFYVDNLVDVFLNDGSVEPLNRYLLIENLLSEKIRSAHKQHLPNQAIDMEMLETFIGQLAHNLLVNEKPYLSKADYYSLAESFIERKGLQRKRFDPDAILAILCDGFVLRDYDGSFGFMMLSVEDYYLAKHMGRDEQFRDSVMSAEGLQRLPSVAEYYIAQNPSDRHRIDQIFAIIDEFEREVWPLIDLIRAEAEEAVLSAAPGSISSLQDEMLSILGEVETNNNNVDDAIVLSKRPEQIGKTRRLKYAAEERGAIFMQLGASILGVSRTLDQKDRIEIFKRMRHIVLICFYTMPFLAQYLADGHEIKFRGITVKSDYVGGLAIQKDRFYLILRGMFYNAMKQFSTWAGSPSFFNAAVELRKDEENEIIIALLFAQNIEADLAEATNFIPAIADSIDSTVLKEVVVRLYLDAMTLVPLDRADESRAIDRLVDATIALNPPKGLSDISQRNRHKVRVRQDLMDKVGISAYVGKLVKPVKGS
jgi:Calcineurin-like phosphoesterase